jgi:hypothetical protein
VLAALALSQSDVGDLAGIVAAAQVHAEDAGGFALMTG